MLIILKNLKLTLCKSNLWNNLTLLLFKLNVYFEDIVSYIKRMH
jgi:hypothetical protein